MPNMRKLQVEHISFEPKMHEDAFQVPQQLSPIEDTETVGVLAKVLLSVKCHKTLILETNIPSPIVEGFDRNCHSSDWDRPGGQSYGLGINPHAQSLDELVIAFSDGASFIRAFHEAHPQADISRTRYITNAQPLVPPIGNLNKFTNLKRLAISEPLGRDFPKLLPKLPEEMQSQFPLETIVLPLNIWGAEQLRTARLHSLAEGKEDFCHCSSWSFVGTSSMLHPAQPY